MLRDKMNAARYCGRFDQLLAHTGRRREKQRRNDDRVKTILISIFSGLLVIWYIGLYFTNLVNDGDLKKLAPFNNPIDYEMRHNYNQL